GAAGYAGAAAMAVTAALRSGVGLVTALVPKGIAPVVAGIVPEAMVHGGPETEIGSLAEDALDTWERPAAGFDAVLAGPGMTSHGATRRIVEKLLSEGTAPLVLDADALNVLAGCAEAVREAGRPVVVTPHPGELARLTGCGVGEVQADRVGAARGAAELTGAVVALKGAGTLVAAGGHPVNVNLTGNPGMAKGGMGDVLAGMVAALAAQGMPPFDAVRAAVYVHGRAGDNVAMRTSQIGMVAGDVIEELPNVFREIAAR
ncbi:NAD(P)H-hydrate dehydratase, partial [Verrucomicrobiota bacterium]